MVYNIMGRDYDAVDESKLILCCALCCANVSFYPAFDCLGCSGKVRKINNELQISSKHLLFALTASLSMLVFRVIL